MIRTYKELRECISYEKKLYNISLFDIITRNQMVYNWKYIKRLRYCEYYRNSKNKLLLPLFLICRIRKNALGKNIGVEIGENCCGKGLLIYHNGSIVINGNARIGENLRLHGNNCIGNLGEKSLGCPTIGNNVSFGVGAIAIGEITIGDNVKIGANATCVKNCKKNNVTFVGTPATVISERLIK